MTALPVTAFFAGLAALALAILGYRVAYYRMRARISYGDKDDTVLRRRIRAHGNFIEYVPVALIALALIEYQGAPKWQAWMFGGVFAAARLFHAVGLTYSYLPLRATGATVTFLALAAAGILLLVRSF